jgi:hypothetical protein
MLKHSKGVIFMTAVLAASSGTLLNGCSSSPLSKKTDAQNLSTTGPSVLNPRTEPGTFELTRDLKPIQSPVVLAEVKDMNGTVTSVRLHFNHAPLDIPMSRVAGTTWRVILTKEQLQKLAVSGQTMRYEATISARNDRGRVGTSESPIEILVKAPEISATG